MNVIDDVNEETISLGVNGGEVNVEYGGGNRKISVRNLEKSL